jgi:ATP synthase protein I
MKFLPFTLKVSAALAAVAAIVGLIFAGGAGALGAFLGVAFVALAYTLSTLLIVRVERINRALMLPAALGVYAAKLFALVLVMGALAERGWDGVKPMGFGVAAAGLMWIVAQSWWIWHAKILYVDLSETD